MKKEKSCGAIIINETGKILLIKHNKGHWAFPKGHVEANETEIETALREIKEETNLEVEINQNIREITTYSPKENVIKDVIYFAATNPTGNIKLQEEEVSEYAWLDLEESLNTITHDDDKRLLINIYNQYKNSLKK